jgi:hypothetical protein
VTCSSSLPPKVLIGVRLATRLKPYLPTVLPRYCHAGALKPNPLSFLYGPTKSRALIQSRVFQQPLQSWTGCVTQARRDITVRPAVRVLVIGRPGQERGLGVVFPSEFLIVPTITLLTQEANPSY